MSDSSGYIYDPEGISVEKLEYIKELKNVKEEEFLNMQKSMGVIFMKEDHGI